jgi:hypothetical protein
MSRSGRGIRRIGAVLLGAVLCLGLASAPSTAGRHGVARGLGGGLGGWSVARTAVDPLATTVRRQVALRLRAAVRGLPVGREHRAGYDRDKFHLWIDADGDCLDTRAEVLTQESQAPVTGGCTIDTGRWYSYYDAVTWTDAADVDIDHVVPLAEAWDSGARSWTAKTRERYANDLADRRTLVAVTDNVNQSKGDQDIAEWMPDHGRCRYLREWAAVKVRWSLRVNGSEKQAMRQLAGQCANRRIQVRIAVVHHRPRPHRDIRLADFQWTKRVELRH